MNRLLDFRTSIDLLDTAIISLLSERMRIVAKVGRYKKERKIKALDKARWQEVLTTKMEMAKKTNLNQELVREMYELIHHYALEIEREV